MAAAPLNIIHRIAQAVLKIGTTNGTAIKEPPYDGEEKGNEARAKWFDEFSAIREALIASNVAKAAEGRDRIAKERLKQTLSTNISKLKAGDKLTMVRGNVSVLLDMRNGSTTVDKEKMMVVLRTEHKWDMEDIAAFLDKISKKGNDKLYTSFSSTDN